MTVRAAIAVLAIVLPASSVFVHDARADDARADDARPDAETVADARFRAAQQQAAAGDPAAVRAAIEAFETLAATPPTTRWTDDAWAETARLAEAMGDHPRARRALDHVISLGADEQLVRRARATRARLAAMTGDGHWDEVAALHQRLVTDAFDGDDPRAELGALEALVVGHPRYPRVNAVRAAIARGWEQEGHTARALRWYREAAQAGAAEPGRPADLALVRALLRAGEIDVAARELARLSSEARRVDGVTSAARVDPAGLASAAGHLDVARRRVTARRAVWLLLALLAFAVIAAMRCETGSFAAAARRLARPPAEAVFLLPLAIVLVALGYLGNPLVAQAVRDITIAGVTVAWTSGALLEAVRARRGRVGLARVTVQMGAALVAVAAAAFLALDHDGLLDLVGETWRGGVGLK